MDSSRKNTKSYNVELQDRKFVRILEGKGAEEAAAAADQPLVTDLSSCSSASITEQLDRRASQPCAQPAVIWGRKSTFVFLQNPHPLFLL